MQMSDKLQFVACCFNSLSLWERVGERDLRLAPIISYAPLPRPFSLEGEGRKTRKTRCGRSNHRDMPLHDSNTGHGIAYFQSEASDFYVTNARVVRDLLIFTTNAGVLFDGVFKR